MNNIFDTLKQEFEQLGKSVKERLSKMNGSEKEYKELKKMEKVFDKYLLEMKKIDKRKAVFEKKVDNYNKKQKSKIH